MEKKCGTHLYRCETAPQAGTVIAQPRLALHHSGAQRCCVRCAPQHEGLTNICAHPLDLYRTIPYMYCGMGHLVRTPQIRWYCFATECHSRIRACLGESAPSKLDR